MLIPMHRIVCLVCVLACASCLVGCGGSGAYGSSGYRTAKNPPKRNTEQARRLNAEALGHLEDEQYIKAEEALKRSLDADVTYAPAHNNLGKVYYHQDKLYEAAWEFRYAIKLMPDHPEPKNNLGLVLERAGKYDEAVAELERAWELRPDNPQFIGNLARVKVRRGDKDEQTRQLLEDVVFKDTRREWVDWAEEQLARLAVQRDD